MGIKGIYQEIGPGERVALQKLAVETYQTKGRPLRLAIDISIWLFQMQSGKGGTNPALRTFYYRLLRLISYSIHPLFVFDGPNKPPFKRDKRTGPNVASIPEFLAKQLLKKFAIPFHIAPGEAEAECALLQQKSIVDAVLSEDVDTLMFGSGITLRSWSPEPGSGSKVNTHVNLYNAEKTKAGKSGLDREGMILVAMMSGGDYLPEGIPGCGPKTACEAARAGFGADLCSLSRQDRAGIAAWKERLCNELKSNESKFFSRKHKALLVPDEFPRRDILGYYTKPVVSSDEQIEALRNTASWDRPLDVVGLRTFCGEAFDWVCISGAKKFVRNIAPCVLIKELRLRAHQNVPLAAEDVAEQEAQLVHDIHGKRLHKTTDCLPELRVSFKPISLVSIDLDAEDPDPEIPVSMEDDEDDVLIVGTADEPAEQVSPSKRGPSKYDPTQLERMWLLETFVKAGVPKKVEEWEESSRRKEAAKLAKETAKSNRQIAKQAMPAGGKKASASGGMQKGALDRFTRVTKPGLASTQPEVAHKPEDMDDPFLTLPSASQSMNANGSLFEVRGRQPFMNQNILQRSIEPVSIDLLSSPEPVRQQPPPKRTLVRAHSDTATIGAGSTDVGLPSTLPSVAELPRLAELPPSVSIRRQRSPLRRIQTLPNACQDPLQRPKTPPKALFTFSPDSSPCASPAKRATGVTRVQSNRKEMTTIINISSSPPAVTPRATRQQSITAWVSPSKPKSRSPVATLDLAGIDDDDTRVALACAVTSRCTNSADPFFASQGPPPQPPKQQQQPRQQPKQKQKRTVRIRDSLDGAWALERAHEEPEPRATPAAKRNKAAAGKGGGVRSFRLSEVQVLDMTGADCDVV